jgi:hypothetical protein
VRRPLRAAALAAGLALCGLPLNAHAFGEPGRWSGGWGQGTSEYTSVATNGDRLYIACNPDQPVTMTLTLAGQDYGSYARQGFDLVIDGQEIQTPHATASRVGTNNFLHAWEALRKARKLVARANGRETALPVRDAAKVLPAWGTPGFDCVTGF